MLERENGREVANKGVVKRQPWERGLVGSAGAKRDNIYFI